jgi:hypothetical protein
MMVKGNSVPRERLLKPQRRDFVSRWKRNALGTLKNWKNNNFSLPA